MDHISIENDDARTILELACAEVCRQGLIPILVIHRFHEALDKLGEDIGSALRDLEHTYNLKTVVTMPVSLTVLRERWEVMDPDKAPFLASDWGQGHRSKMLKGYTRAELSEIGAKRGIDDAVCDALHRATAGLVDLVEILLDEVRNKKGKGLTLYLQQRAPEICKRTLDWLDPVSSSHTYKKSLINLLDTNFYPSALSFIRDHDWNPILLNKNSELGFLMLAWAANTTLSKLPDSQWIETLSTQFRDGNFDSARSVIEMMYGSDKKNRIFWLTLRHLAIFCKSTSDVFSRTEEWDTASRTLLKLLNSQKPKVPEHNSWIVSDISKWKTLIDLLSGFLSVKSSCPTLRIEQYICERSNRNHILPFLQLMHLRLQAAEKANTYQALQCIVSAPESLLQIYAYFECDIRFWAFDGLSNSHASRLGEVARKPYHIKAGRLGYSDLAFLIKIKDEDNNRSPALFIDNIELDDALANYELRKESAHSTIFAERESCEKYRLFLLHLLHRYVSIIGETPQSIALPSPKLSALELIKLAPQAPV
ncbi:hypothetical protein NAU58_21170 [Pseudomonas stutzeri]|uniref:hypothetical protein n=1 Tax=Stutzerimonas stutzeri TaxID=316 RepID=UPI00210AA346|nr:hypothetical protein [Stutzerimonas stutzeri]MCQ4298093.1 hypothetical protein [Stutzerimonas stutzeri]